MKKSLTACSALGQAEFGKWWAFSLTIDVNHRRTAFIKVSAPVNYNTFYWLCRSFCVEHRWFVSPRPVRRKTSGHIPPLANTSDGYLYGKQSGVPLPLSVNHWRCGVSDAFCLISCLSAAGLNSHQVGLHRWKSGQHKGTAFYHAGQWHWWCRYLHCWSFQGVPRASLCTFMKIIVDSWRIPSFLNGAWGLITSLSGMNTCLKWVSYLALPDKTVGRTVTLLAFWSPVDHYTEPSNLAPWLLGDIYDCLLPTSWSSICWVKLFYSEWAWTFIMNPQ